jgi:hypothetical protein
MSRANPLWGAPHIHGELLKLGFEVAQSTVARYMWSRSWPPSRGWRTFLSNHVDGIAAVDLFVLPTIGFQILCCLVVVCGARGSRPGSQVCPSRHCGVAADPNPLTPRDLLGNAVVKSSILERNSLRIGEVFALL